MRPIRIALYGDVNLNIIDGSAIWLVSLAETLHAGPRVDLTVLLKAPEQRSSVTAPLHRLEKARLVTAPGAAGPLKPAQALDALESLDAEQRFDLFVVRGYALSREAARRPKLRGRLWTYLTDIPQQAWAATAEDLDALTRIAEASDRLLCQTEELRSHLEGLVAAASGKTILLPPMIPPEFMDERGRDLGSPPKLFYAGKFAPLWGFLETVEQFRRLRSEIPDVELHVAGDKVHNPPEEPGYAPAVRAALEDTEGLVWHGGVTRDQVRQLLGQVDFALSVRHVDLNASLELSTKILEYGAAGVPVILNRNPMHVDLYGANYPLFIDAFEDLAGVVRTAVADPDVWRGARTVSRDVARKFTFPEIAARLAPHLERTVPDVPVTSARRRPRVVVAGHDLKFFAGLETHLLRAGADVRRDQWDGHDRHDETASKKLCEWADVVVAEWCLGNAVWYARHRQDDQRLLVRFHLQERDTEFPRELDLDAVERMVFVGEELRRDAHERFGWPLHKLAVVPNTVDTLAFDRPKLPEARYHVGMLGYLPHRKRLDRALDVLEALRRNDDRFRLFVAGPFPWETPWVWGRIVEREYYREQFRRIRRSRRLYEGVNFDGRCGNVPSWMRKIGHVLSVSDFESFHLAPAEGMASRAVPALVRWDGVAALYPDRWIHDSTESMAERVAATAADGWLAEGQAARDYIEERYSFDRVAQAWTKLVFDGG